MSEPIVRLLEEEWRSIDDLCSSITDAEWMRGTDLPNWTVQDVLAHLVGTESILLGRPVPDVEVTDRSHVHNKIGEMNEPWVVSRRDDTGPEVLDEFREVTAARVEMLDGMSTEDFDADSFTPRGPGTYREFMEVRLFDSWVHEQDIRRAVWRPGHLAGPVVDQVMSEVDRALPYVVGKKAAAPQGASVVFDIEGPTRYVRTVVVDGRARLDEEAPSDPTVRIRSELEPFIVLATGRTQAPSDFAGETVEITGDEALGREIVKNLGFVI